jgi:Holliday junction resolvasome RuvABC endonuclease subunit
MAKESQRIIGINPGTRYLGIAVLYGQELMDWRIKTLDGKWSEKKIEKARKILAELIDLYEPNVLVIKKLHPARRTENLLRLTNKIKDFAKKKKLRVYQYSIKEIEKRFSDGEKLNKRNLIEAMVKLYPAIRLDLDKEKSHRNQYYFRVFEALAVAAIFSRLRP